jgi:hypothetical protein
VGSNPPNQNSFTVGQSVTTSGGRNARMAPLSVQGSQRKMKSFTITELELTGLSKWGNAEKQSTALAYGLWSFAIGLIVQGLFADFSKLSSIAQAICLVCSPILIVLGIFCFCQGKNYSQQVKDIEETIKTETTHI